MDGRLQDGMVVVGDGARQRFHDARGYGRPLGGDDLALSEVEAAHLLFRGDLDSVDGAGFEEFLAAADAEVGPRFLVYKDLRDRGFYLSPAREGWIEGDATDADSRDVDFVVYPRGQGPWDGEVRYRVRAVGERTRVSAASLGDCVLAVVDEESDITYFETATADLAGETKYEPPGGIEGTLLGDRVVVWDPPADLHSGGFYGRPLADRDDADADGDALHLSLVEAAYLAAEGALAIPETDRDGVTALLDRGREVEGDRFDRRLRIYRALRTRGLVPKTGFKFGADFRAYASATSADDPGHAEYLVRVLPPGHEFDPRDLALDVRLAGGVRKRMIFARHASNTDTPDWLYVSRLTP